MKKFRKFEDIINNKNLLFDIKNDLIFRNVFLNKCSLNYVCKLLHYLLGYDLNDLKNNLKIVNNEHPSNSVFNNINRSDVIYEYKDIYIIFEMNSNNMKHHINKNYYYLFKQHSSRLNNKNNYNKKTILINIDDYDVNKRNEIVYTSKILDTKYYANIYNLINIIHINIDSLRNKMYNNIELNDLERLLIIFIEQDRRNLVNKNVEKEVIDIMDYIARMDFREGDPVTYNREEELKILEEMALEDARKAKEDVRKAKEDARKAKEDARKAKEDARKAKEVARKAKEEKQQVANEKQQVASEKKQLEEEKIEFAKALKAEGYPMNKILKLTKLSKSKIMML